MPYSFRKVTPELVRAHCESRQAALELAGLTGLAEVLAPSEFVVAWAEQMRDHPDWLGFWVILDCEVIGTGGYKGAPQESEVEIGYQIHESHWGRGAATELCGVLVDHAFSLGVTTVHAHTLVAGEASQAVLRKNGFRLMGEVVDPEDGVVLRWSRNRSTLNS